ncbi:MAG: tryptophan-rich sensory protein, partial [Clostridia bacterium]|nr:tryptophan-rich sensory protein [Clostridia bacterium]
AVLFPIVWGILYVIMGISIAMILLKGRSEGIYTVPCVKIYALQLAVNFFWSIILFNMQNFLLSLVWLLFLLVLVIIQVFKFYRICKLSAYLQIPYILWLVFAAVLNYSIFTLNG